MVLDHEFLSAVKNDVIISAFYKAERYVSTHNKIICSISGGADSDIMVDMLTKVDNDNKVLYVWFDTGLEYQATKDHLDYLEQKYDIKINKRKAVLPIPTCCHKFGQPFLSKYVSEMIERLQRHDFKWEDEAYSTLLPKYPNAKSALKWWCSWHDEDLAEHFPSQSGKSSKWSISRNRYLREFMIENPPQFAISAKCCEWAKKKVSTKAEAEFKPDMIVVGIRKSEGGVRAGAYKTCYGFDQHKGMDAFRPLFWFTNADKEEYCKLFDVHHSSCYEAYGLKRTGCVGCPFGRNVLDDLEASALYEPKLYRACTTIFAESYEYTRQYREFVKKKKKEEGEKYD